MEFRNGTVERSPDDVWLVDLDEAKIFPPETNSEVTIRPLGN